MLEEVTSLGREKVVRNKRRKFIKRSKFRNKTRIILKCRVHLWSNFSHLLTKAKEKYLDLCLDFVPLSKIFNRTEVEASFMQFNKRQAENQEENDDVDDTMDQEEKVKNIFKDKKQEN